MVTFGAAECAPVTSGNTAKVTKCGCSSSQDCMETQGLGIERSRLIAPLRSGPEEPHPKTNGWQGLSSAGRGHLD